MAIIFNKKKQTFSLNTMSATYQLKIGNLGYVNHLYYGDQICDEDMSYLIRCYDRGFSGNPYDSLKEPESRHLRAAEAASADGADPR